MPWHTDRTRVAELASVLGMAIGVLGKMARDITLFAQAEVAEVAEGEGPEHGTSSTLPQKQNPVRAVLILAAADRAPGLVGTAFHAMVQEHERATGAWHAEWETQGQLLRLAGGASHHAARLLETLNVDAARMDEPRLHGRACDGREPRRVSLLEDRPFGRESAGAPLQRGVRRATRAVRRGGRARPGGAAASLGCRIASAFDPLQYLGSTPELIRRAQDAHRSAGVTP